MARIVLVTGGARSGKSDFAQGFAEKSKGPHYFVATCQPLDQEMKQRISLHQNQRSPAIWQTIEEPLELAQVITKINRKSTILIDCITLWISNLLHAAKAGGTVFDHVMLDAHLAPLITTLTQSAHTVVIVTNEVGQGIVPANQLARTYRDLVGTCNRVMARHAQTVYLVTCGIPVKIK